VLLARSAEQVLAPAPSSILHSPNFVTTELGRFSL
jgi:hypothetical protein